MESSSETLPALSLSLHTHTHTHSTWTPGCLCCADCGDENGSTLRSCPSVELLVSSLGSPETSALLQSLTCPDSATYSERTLFQLQNNKGKQRSSYCVGAGHRWHFLFLLTHCLILQEWMWMCYLWELHLDVAQVDGISFCLCKKWCKSAVQRDGTAAYGKALLNRLFT